MADRFSEKEYAQLVQNQLAANRETLGQPKAKPQPRPKRPKGKTEKPEPGRKLLPCGGCGHEPSVEWVNRMWWDGDGVKHWRCPCSPGVVRAWYKAVGK